MLACLSTKDTIILLPGELLLLSLVLPCSLWFSRSICQKNGLYFSELKARATVHFANSSTQSSPAWGEKKSPGPQSLLHRAPLLPADGSKLTDPLSSPCLSQTHLRGWHKPVTKLAGVNHAGRDPQTWRERIYNWKSKSLPTPDKQTVSEWVNNSY